MEPPNMRLKTNPDEMDEDNRDQEIVVEDCRFVLHDPRGRPPRVVFEWTWSTPEGQQPRHEPNGVPVAFLPDDDEAWVSDAWRTFMEALHDSGLPEEDLQATLDAGEVGDVEDAGVREEQSEMFREALAGKRFRSGTDAFGDDPRLVIRVLSEYVGDASV